MVTMESPDPVEGSQIKDRGGSSSNKKKKNLTLGSFKSPFKFLGKTYCKGCRKKCSGEVLRVNDVYFHSNCFKCKGCSNSLSQGGFFTRDKDYYCATCYQSNFGTTCFACNKFVEGEVVTALGKTYHQRCFRCANCDKTFPTGERVTFTGKSCLCTACAKISSNSNAASPRTANDVVDAAATASPVAPARHDASDPIQKVSTAAQKGTGAENKKVGPVSPHSASDKCAGCSEELKEGQALMALDKQFHVWCFKCKSCNALLHGEYMGKDGNPYCEKDYQALFGVKCTYCLRFISGKVLQAGENNHFHPTCARCTKCGEPFGDGEEMFLQGAAIWHPRCGPGPDESGMMVVNGYESKDFDGASSVSEHIMPYGGSRASSPGASLRHAYPGGPHYRSGWGGTYSPALYHSSSTYSLRRPLEPGDRTGSASHLNHFHLPASRRSSTAMAPSRYANNTSMDSIPVAAMMYRPISAPPKPGYTQASSRSATLPATPYKFNDYPGRSHTSFDMMSTHSFRTDYSAAPTPITDHKIYPLHLLFTSNYKMPPDVDRCNLEKHLADADFEMAFNMNKDEFYSLPLWRRNDLKRRIRLF